MLKYFISGILACLCLTALAEKEEVIIEQAERAPASVAECRDVAKDLHELVDDEQISPEEAKSQFVEQGCQRLQKRLGF